MAINHHFIDGLDGFAHTIYDQLKADAIKFMKFLSIVIIGDTLDPSSRRRDVRAS